MTDPILWINALSTRPSLEAAVTEVVDRVKLSLSTTPDLGIIFIASAYASEYSRLIPLLLEQLSLPIVIGCGGAGIVGLNSQNQAVEVEDTPALSLSIACLPEVNIKAFHLSAEQLPDLDSPPTTWIELVGVSPRENPQFVLLADPFSSKINDLLEGLDFAYPSSAKIGGLASATAIGSPAGLFCYSQGSTVNPLYRDGTVGLALSGNIELETIVAQGCRPIGQSYQVIKGDRNIILEVAELAKGDSPSNTNRERGVQPETLPFQCGVPGASRPPLVVLQELIGNLSEEDRELAQQSLFIGIARDEFKQRLEQGDFLIRNLVGYDPRTGALAVGDRVRPGQRVQFHLRDAQTSAEDLRLLLEAYQQRGKVSPAVGALMFSCVGRGKALYNQLNFDSDLFRLYLKEVPLGGFFCNGEIGPVGGTTFLHGYTSAFAIFRQP